MKKRKVYVKERIVLFNAKKGKVQKRKEIRKSEKELRVKKREEKREEKIARKN